MVVTKGGLWMDTVIAQWIKNMYAWMLAMGQRWQRYYQCFA